MSAAQMHAREMSGKHTHWLHDVPDLAGLAHQFPEAFPFLLDSVANGQPGRRSLLLYASADILVRHSSGIVTGPGQGESFFDRLDSWYRSEKSGEAHVVIDNEREVPFLGGWFVYLGYEIAAEIEASLHLPAQGTSLPDAFARRCPGAVIVFHPDPEGQCAEPRALVVAESADLLAKMLLLLDRAGEPQFACLPRLERLEAEQPGKFTADVKRILRYLRDGDVFQVNLSRLWTGRFAHAPDPVAVYRQLCQHNPAPFAGMMRWGAATLLSSSPERLVQIRGRRVETRPIAGTRPRGKTADQDLALSQELIDNVKERAEHIMLIDLERNDLGRVCVPGTIEVNELMVIESYAHVHHIVSNVCGDLQPGATPVDTIKAVFPGGTITGCPKVRCMEIIAELEQVGRGFYTGSMGYLGLDGSMDFNILIRSMLLEDCKVTFRTGAGIVADSEPEHELQETLDKARGMLLALSQDVAEDVTKDIEEVGRA
jgi:anthranilate synthase component 1